mmetsp:Transcript_75335/g.189512  ORF Transcript_75335/g.189512 Transcript_75335/m.189512 type:complete len:329 (+) Transcript_75335:1253-2239(+)
MVLSIPLLRGAFVDDLHDDVLLPLLPGTRTARAADQAREHARLRLGHVLPADFRLVHLRHHLRNCGRQGYGLLGSHVSTRAAADLHDGHVLWHAAASCRARPQRGRGPRSGSGPGPGGATEAGAGETSLPRHRSLGWLFLPPARHWPGHLLVHLHGGLRVVELRVLAILDAARRAGVALPHALLRLDLRRHGPRAAGELNRQVLRLATDVLPRRHLDVHVHVAYSRPVSDDGSARGRRRDEADVGDPRRGADLRLSRLALHEVLREADGLPSPAAGEQGTSLVARCQQWQQDLCRGSIPRRARGPYNGRRAAQLRISRRHSAAVRRRR